MIICFLLLLADILLLNIAFALSFLIRYGFRFPESSFSAYKGSFVFLTLVYMTAFVFAKVFSARFRSHWEVFRRVFVGLLLGTLFGMALIYVFRIKWSAFPSSIFVASFLIGLIIIFTCNCVLLRLTGRIKKKIVFVGNTKTEPVHREGRYEENICLDRIEDILQYKDIDEIIICEKSHEESQLNFLIYLLIRSKVNVFFAPSIYQELLSENIIKNNNVQFLATFLGKRSEREEFLIKLLDIVGSLAILVVTLPLSIMAVIAIKFSSQGPILYKQERAGKDGRVFSLYKFRTMLQEAEKKTGPVLASENDPRVTKVGRFLRDTRIDELPQLINVLRGEMSLVGPRPERPYFTKLHETLRGIRLAVKPGLTGIAQVRSPYELKAQHKIRYDYLYIQRRSVALNLYLLIKTIPVVLLRKGR